MLICCLLPLLVKINAATFEINTKNLSEGTTKKYQRQYHHIKANFIVQYINVKKCFTPFVMGNMLLTNALLIDIFIKCYERAFIMYQNINYLDLTGKSSPTIL